MSFLAPGVWTSWCDYFLLVVILAVHAGAQSHLAWVDSDTIDEPAHLVAALSSTRKGGFRLYSVNPPLSRFVQGAFLSGKALDTSMIVEPDHYGARTEAGVGRRFIRAHPDEYRTILFRARLGSVLVSLVGGIMVWWWANEAFGPPCGLLGLVVWCCDPMVLAQGHLGTPDMPGAVTAFAAALTMARYLSAPTLLRALAVGATLGLALLAKFTLLLLAPMWLLIWLWASRQSGTSIRQGLLAAAACLLIVNCGYLFQDSGRRLEQFRFLSTKLGHLTPETVESISGPTNALGGTWLGAMPVPLPAPFLEGIDLQAKDFDRYAQQDASFFMAGQWQKGGRYHYYLYGLLVKEPLALFGLLAVAGVVLARRPTGKIDLQLLIAIPLGILLFVSSQKAMNKHVRYVLPILPFLATFAGAAGRVYLNGRLWPRLLVGLLAGWSIVAATIAFRDPIAYFNEAAGGSRGGVRHLAGSNVDWGQGRHRLRAWLEAHPDFRPVSVACYGTGEHVFAGMGLGLPPVGPDEEPVNDDLAVQQLLGPHPGRFAVSARVLQGDLRVVTDAEGDDHYLHNGTYTYFQLFEPITLVGGSVWIFDISLEEANRVRGELGLAPLERP